MLRLLLFLSVTTLSLANSQESKHQLSNEQNPAEVGYVAQSWTYTESSSDRGQIMEESGILQGVRASYRFSFFEDRFFIKPEASYIGGKTTYNGATWSGVPVTSKDRNVIADANLEIGPRIRTGLGQTDIGISGYYRLLMHPRTSGPGSYRREISYQTIGLGLSHQVQLSDRFSLKAIGRYDYFLEGNVKTYLGRANSKYPNLEMKQNEGRGMFLALEAKVRLDNESDIVVRPFYRYWQVDDSEKSDVYEIFNDEKGIWEAMYWVEPYNKTNSFGLNLALQF